MEAESFDQNNPEENNTQNNQLPEQVETFIKTLPAEKQPEATALFVRTVSISVKKSYRGPYRRPLILKSMKMYCPVVPTEFLLFLRNNPPTE